MLRQQCSSSGLLQPHKGATWRDIAVQSDINDFHKGHPGLANAPSLRSAWAEAMGRVEKLEVNVLLTAYGAAACENEWLFHLVVEKKYLTIPGFIFGFWDPYSSARLSRKCDFHPKKMGRPNPPGQQELYRLVFGRDFEGAHYAEADEKALCEIISARPDLFATRLVLRKGASGGVQTWQELNGKKEEKRNQHFAETTSEEAGSWKGGDSAATVDDNEYSGPKYGPAGEAARPLFPTVMLLLFFPVTMLKTIAGFTNKYAIKDWVVNTNPKPKGRPAFRMATRKDPKRQHRHDPKKWVVVTHWSILCFIGILIGRGAMGTRNLDSLWSVDEYGLGVTWISNVMSRNTFRQHLRYIKFADNEKAPKKGSKGYSPLWKAKLVLDAVNKVSRSLWTCGRFITVDESMVAYSGRAIDWVVYNPKKPIKHGTLVLVTWLSVEMVACGLCMPDRLIQVACRYQAVRPDLCVHRLYVQLDRVHRKGQHARRRWQGGHCPRPERLWPTRRMASVGVRQLVHKHYSCDNAAKHGDLLDRNRVFDFQEGSQ